MSDAALFVGRSFGDTEIVVYMDRLAACRRCRFAVGEMSWCGVELCSMRDGGRHQWVPLWCESVKVLRDADSSVGVIGMNNMIYTYTVHNERLLESLYC